jgi:glucosylceramidase
MDYSDRRNGRASRRARILWSIGGGSLVILAVILVVALARTGGDPGPAQPTSSPSGAAVVARAASTTAVLGDALRGLDVSVGEATGQPAPGIMVDDTISHQQIGGFGAALTHSSAELIAALDSESRDRLLRELFAPDEEVRLSALRVPIGASDFISTEPFTFDDLPPGEEDWEMERFDLQPDRQALIPVLQEIVSIAPHIRITATPWSPPAWLKTTGTLEGGRLIDEDRAYESYARYLVRFVTEYRAAGIHIDYLTVQNEPQLRHPDGYPGTDMPVWQAAKLIESLGPALEESGLDTRILGYDHNWELNPSDAASTPAGEDPAYRYPADLLRTPAAQWIAGTAFHCYYGAAAAQARLLEEFPDLEVWVTECSGSSSPGDSAEKTWADTLSWQAVNLFIEPLRNGANGVLLWNLALDENHGPHHGGCATCSGVVTIHSDGVIERNAEYAALAQTARFVPPGSRRVESRGPDDLKQVAFRTPDGQIVVLVWNSHSSTTEVTIGDGRQLITVGLPAKSLTSVSWEPPR